MNLKVNRPYARKWVQETQLQMFNVVKGGVRFSLKAFLNPEEKILWLEFRTTGTTPNFSCPFSLSEDPVNFRTQLDAEWLMFQKISKKSMDEVSNT